MRSARQLRSILARRLPTAASARPLSTAITTIKVPPILQIGGGSASSVSDTLKTLGCKKPLIVTDAFFSNSPMLASLRESLSDAALEHATFDGVVPDPTTDSLDAGVALAKASSSDSVIGFGGGSSIDSAKAIAVLVEHGAPLSRFKAPVVTPSGLPVVAVLQSLEVGVECGGLAESARRGWGW